MNRTKETVVAGISIALFIINFVAIGQECGFKGFKKTLSSSWSIKWVLTNLF
ncbi:MAG: hypothetical protein JW800_02035 [Candidatus Omnitrophica bacterium]|nr:hypothetical protein [Candidatus Omnitrophota bacterium]